MSLLLTHAYYLYKDPKERHIMKPYPPLGLLYISSYLNKHNVENEVYDSTFNSFSQQLDYIHLNKPKVVAIYTNLMTKINVLELVKILKSKPKYGNPKIVLGGPDITFNCENYLSAGADFLVIGEGEQTMLELYLAIVNKSDFSAIPGIAFIDKSILKKTVAREKIKNMASLPIPNRDAIAMDKYLDVWKSAHGKSSMTVSTQRGCPYTCKWCSTAVYGLSYRRRPAHLVAQELKQIKDRYKPDSIWFVDDVFSVSHKWIKSFHKEVIKQDAIIPFECITRAERLNDEVLKLLKEAGCYRIWIGAESGSQSVIDAMDRRVDVDVVKEAIQQTNALGIETGTFIMVGYPGERKEDIDKTINYLIASNPTHFTITVAYPIKGTALYSDIEDLIVDKPNWETSTDRDIDFERAYPRKFYDYAVRRIVNEVNYNKEIKKGRDKNLFEAFKFKSKSILAHTAMKLYQ